MYREKLIKDGLGCIVNYLEEAQKDYNKHKNEILNITENEIKMLVKELIKDTKEKRLKWNIKDTGYFGCINFTTKCKGYEIKLVDTRECDGQVNKFYKLDDIEIKHNYKIYKLSKILNKLYKNEIKLITKK
jgi:lysyl-tRNA synthetase class II